MHLIDVNPLLHHLPLRFPPTLPRQGGMPRPSNPPADDTGRGRGKKGDGKRGYVSSSHQRPGNANITHATTKTHWEEGKEPRPSEDAETHQGSSGVGGKSEAASPPPEDGAFLLPLAARPPLYCGLLACFAWQKNAVSNHYPDQWHPHCRTRAKNIPSSAQSLPSTGW